VEEVCVLVETLLRTTRQWPLTEIQADSNYCWSSRASSTLEDNTRNPTVRRLICSPIEPDTEGAILLLGKEMGSEIPEAAQDVVKKVRRW